jgi:NitT/TauT family transport system substrate-binding protein
MLFERPMKRRRILAMIASLPACRPRSGEMDGVLRLGHFPNLTHVQALVAHQLTRQGKGWFEPRLGVEVRWFVYNAGPSVAEAIFARSLDAAYMGPSPLLNAFVRSEGREMRVLSGAVNGGAALLVRPEAHIERPEDFRGKRLATPQLGNTQDVQARAWLRGHGFSVSFTEHDVSVIPTKSADQLALFAKGELDAVWTTEPWASRLEMEQHAQVFEEDRETPVTLLAGRADFVEKQAALAGRLVAAHQELTAWIGSNAEEAKELMRQELETLTTQAPSSELLERALRRMTLTDQVEPAAMHKLLTDAQAAGFLRSAPPLENLFWSPPALPSA